MTEFSAEESDTHRHDPKAVEGPRLSEVFRQYLELVRKLGIDNMLNCVGLFCPFPIFCRLPFR